jgi:quercetin dioxygenase-like cupin family protein
MGPASYFSGTVFLDDISAGPDTGNVRITRVTFAPGARTAWHTHPHGQLLHILSGVGRVQKDGEGVIDVFPGDTVWFQPGERHWHGASPDRTMVHLAVQQVDEAGNAVTWQEHVASTV